MSTNIIPWIIRAVILLSQKDFHQHWTKTEPQLFPEMRSDIICQVYLLQQTPSKSTPITPDQCPTDFPWAYNEVGVISTKSSLRFYLQRGKVVKTEKPLCEWKWSENLRLFYFPFPPILIWKSCAQGKRLLLCWHFNGSARLAHNRGR